MKNHCISNFLALALLLGMLLLAGCAGPPPPIPPTAYPPPVAEQTLRSLNIATYEQAAKEEIDSFVNQLYSRHVFANSWERDKLRELLYLVAVEHALGSNVQSLRSPEDLPVIVTADDATYSVFKAGTWPHCDFPFAESIRAKQLREADLFLVSADYTKFQELKLDVAIMEDDPFKVAEDYFGGVLPDDPLRTELGMTSVSFPLQCFVWKLKVDIVEDKEAEDILAWYKEYDFDTKLVTWAQ